MNSVTEFVRTKTKRKGELQMNKTAFVFGCITLAIGMLVGSLNMLSPRVGIVFPFSNNNLLK
jgi:hypothetical protein